MFVDDFLRYLQNKVPVEHKLRVGNTLESSLLKSSYRSQKVKALALFWPANRRRISGRRLSLSESYFSRDERKYVCGSEDSLLEGCTKVVTSINI